MITESGVVNYLSGILVNYKQLLSGLIIGLIPSIFAIYNNKRRYEFDLKLSDKRYSHEKLFNENTNLKKTLTHFIEKINVANPQDADIGDIWQIQQKIHFFSDTSNPHQKNLLRAISKFSSSYESMKICASNPEFSQDSISVTQSFNTANEELISVVNKYFEHSIKT